MKLGILRNSSNKIIVFIFICFHLFYIQNAFAETVIAPNNIRNNVKLESHIGGYQLDNCIVDNILYTATGSGLQIYSLSTPTNPALLGEILLNECVFDVAVSGDYAYVSAWDSTRNWGENSNTCLQIIDISNPASPKLIGVYQTKSFPYDVSILGNFAYIAEPYVGMEIIDISNPKYPTFVNLYNKQILGAVISVFTDNNFAYLACTNAGIEIVNIANPQTPYYVSSYDTAGSASDAFIKDEYLFIAEQQGSAGNITVVNISNPLSPQFEISLPTLRKPVDIEIKSNNAIISGYSNEDLNGFIQRFDITNPMIPLDKGNVEFYYIEPFTGISITEGYAFVSGVYLRIFDISDPDKIIESGKLNTTQINNDNQVSGNLVSTASFYFDLIDSSDPTKPFLKSSLDESTTANSIHVQNSYAYLVTNGDGLKIIDFSNPEVPIVVGEYDQQPDYTIYTGVFVQGNFAYLIKPYKLLIIDISEPSDPVLKGSCNIDTYSNNIFVSGDYAYITGSHITGGSDKFFIVDISDSTNPEVKSSYDTDEYCLGVFVDGSYAYVVGDNFEVLDISNPLNPINVGSCQIYGQRCGDIYVEGNYAYIANCFAGLQVIDISSPTTPKIVGRFNTPNWARGISFSEGNIFLSDNTGGLYIFQYLEDNAPPEGNLSAGEPYSGTEGQPVIFDASNSTDNDDIKQYKWSWDGDDVYEETSVLPYAKHSFPDNDSYTVKLRVSDFSDNTDTTTTVVNILNSNPIGDAGADKQVLKQEEVNFQGSAVDAPADMDTLTYEWDFDWDQNPLNFIADDTTKNVSYFYNNPGIYTVGFRVTDKDGGVGYDSLNVEVINQLVSEAYLPNIVKNYYGWNTPFVIQNLGSEDATIQARFINQVGGQDHIQTYTNVQNGNSVCINPANESALGLSWNGSVVIYADQPVASIVNEHSSKTSMAYEGIDPANASTKTYLPNITREYYGWTTPFIIQNLDSTDETINIRYFRKGEAVPALEETVTGISPGSSVSDNPLSKTSLGTFQGSVVVESTGKVGAVVNEHFGTTQAMSYNGFSAGGNTIYLPNITRDYYGWTTPFIIQNIGTEEVTVTASFYPKGSSFSSYDETITGLAPGSNASINPAKVSSLGTFQGSVVVQANSGEIVAVVNEHSSTDSMAYSSIQSGEATNYLPNITKNYYGWTTPLAIQNLSLASALVDIDFYDSSGTKIHTISGQSIQPGSTFSLNPAGQSALGSIFKGSVAVICTNGQNITSIVNEHHSSGQAMSYNGFKSIE